jgi:hypothetical protein
LIVAVLSSSPGYSSPTAEQCVAMRKDLESKSERMSEYISMLQKFSDQKDIEVIGVMNQKISELAEQILKLEKDLADCDKQKPNVSNQGLGVVKSDEGRYATARCGELRKKLVQLLQKAQSLRRRENSLLSEFTSADKRELREAEQDIEAVKAALKARCPASVPPKPFRRNPHADSTR